MATLPAIVRILVSCACAFLAGCAHRTPTPGNPPLSGTVVRGSLPRVVDPSLPVLHAATLVHLRSPSDEAWDAMLNDVPICRLPCDRWILPDTTWTLQRSDGERLSLTGKFRGVPERDVVISKARDPLYPWLGLGTAAFGAGFTALSIALATGAISPAPAKLSSGNGSSGSGYAGQTAKNLAGIAIVGTLAVLLDGFSVVYLVRGPAIVPTLRLEAPQESKRGVAFTASPEGVGFSF